MGVASKTASSKIIDISKIIDSSKIITEVDIMADKIDRIITTTIRSKRHTKISSREAAMGLDLVGKEEARVVGKVGGNGSMTTSATEEMTGLKRKKRKVLPRNSNNLHRKKLAWMPQKSMML